MSSSRALHRRANGSTPYTTANATATTAAAMAMVRRSRGSSAGLCTEREREAFIRSAAFAVASGRGEEAGIGEALVAVEGGKDRGGVRRGAVDAPLVADRARAEHGHIARQALAEGGDDPQRIHARRRHAARDRFLAVHQDEASLQGRRGCCPRLERGLIGFEPREDVVARPVDGPDREG